MNLRLLFHKTFGPIRRFTYLENEEFICILKTPGFSKQDVYFSFTPNELVQISGSKILYEGKQKIITFELDELIHIPIGVVKNTIRWNVENGCTILRCHRKIPT